MQSNRLHTLWIMFTSTMTIVVICFKSIGMHILGKTNRPWVDKTIQNWAHKVLKKVRVQYTVVNPHNVEPINGKPTIVMCNHSSLYDIPLSFLAFPNHSIRMLAKKELSHIPLMGQGMRAAEFPFIDRKNRRQAIQDLEEVKNLLKSGIVMWIAPEGTRSKTGRLAPFKKGAFIIAIEMGATIIPIGIRGAYEILPAKTFQLNLDQKAEVHIGSPIDASMYTLENKEVLINLVHARMKSLIGQDNAN